MRQYTNLIIILFLICVSVQISFGAIKGGLKYNIPIDYTNLNETELSEKAEFFYNKAGKTMNDDMTSALNLYSILSQKNPENITYTLRLGYLYSLIGKERYAKGNFYKAISIAPQKPEPYFYLGEYYFSRSQYRKALKFYKEAYSKGYNTHPQTIVRLKQIYRKLGDTKSLNALNG